MRPVDPGAGQIREGIEVDIGSQPLGLEPTHLAAGSGEAIQPLADDRPHRRITGEPLGVIDILVAREPAEHRLPKQSFQRVARVLAAAAVEELRDRHVGEPERVIQLAVGEQAAVGCDPGAVEFELDPSVEGGPQRRLLGFIRRVPQDPTHSSPTTLQFP